MSTKLSLVPRMDGTPLEQAHWRIQALREALCEIVSSRGDGALVQLASNALGVDDSNEESPASTPCSSKERGSSSFPPVDAGAKITRLQSALATAREQHDKITDLVGKVEALEDTLSNVEVELAEAKDALATARREALEEAAQVADRKFDDNKPKGKPYLALTIQAMNIANEIRALLSQSVEVGPTSSGNGEV